MKLLISLLLLFGCGNKTNSTTIEDLTPEENNNTISTSAMSFEYEQKIDIFVAFLWPLKIETPAAKRSVIKILDVGRSLRTGNEELLGYSIEFKKLRCEEIFAGEIIVDFETEDYCYEVEEKRNSLTAVMLEKVNTMKSEVQSMGGEWLDSNQDFETNEGSLIDFNTNTLSIYSLGSKVENGETAPLPYPKLPFEIKMMDSYSYIELFFPRKDGVGIFKIKADLNIQKNSIIFQGDLNLVTGESTQRGIIYWQLLKRTSSF